MRLSKLSDDQVKKLTQNHRQQKIGAVELIRRLPSLFIYFILAVYVEDSFGATLLGYNERQIWGYIEHMPRENLTTKCSSSLNRVSLFIELLKLFSSSG